LSATERTPCCSQQALHLQNFTLGRICNRKKVQQKSIKKVWHQFHTFCALEIDAANGKTDRPTGRVTFQIQNIHKSRNPKNLELNPKSPPLPLNSWSLSKEKTKGRNG
jgi:hypothetical protein